MRIDITNDHRINCALSAAANGAIAAGKTVAVGAATLAILAGAKSINGFVWRVATGAASIIWIISLVV